MGWGEGIEEEDEEGGGGGGGDGGGGRGVGGWGWYCCWCVELGIGGGVCWVFGGVVKGVCGVEVDEG
uniref:Uncharacterized protein n=1 Tax=Knipowitschia caucasica TaxID=637954 RepID=A0AAV2JQE3_KNICA